MERVLGRRPGVRLVDANPVAQTATVTFDTAATSVAELRRWVEDCGYHCTGQSVPSHVCDPMAEPDPADGHRAVTAGHGEAAAAALEPPASRREHPAHPGHEAGVPEAPPAHAGDHMAAAEHAGQETAAGENMPSPHETMGHGGAAGMSMEAMVADMRNRFLVAALLSVPILLWSPIGRDVLGFTAATPFGLRDDIWLLLLSLPRVAPLPGHGQALTLPGPRDLRRSAAAGVGQARGVAEVGVSFEEVDAGGLAGARDIWLPAGLTPLR